MAKTPTSLSTCTTGQWIENISSSQTDCIWEWTFILPLMYMFSVNNMLTDAEVYCPVACFPHNFTGKRLNSDVGEPKNLPFQEITLRKPIDFQEIMLEDLGLFFTGSYALLLTYLNESLGILTKQWVLYTLWCTRRWFSCNQRVLLQLCKLISNCWMVFTCSFCCVSWQAILVKNYSVLRNTYKFLSISTIYLVVCKHMWVYIHHM